MRIAHFSDIHLLSLRGVSPTAFIGKRVIEGIPTTRSVMQLAREHDVEMPITRAVYDVVFEAKNPIVAISDLMTRTLKSE